MSTPPTPYEILGGEARVRAVVQALYDRLFEDPMVGFLFAGKDKARLVEHQVAFTCAFLGGPRRYVGKPLPEAHAQLPLLPGHFDRRHWLLREVLEEQGVAEEASAAWLSIDQGLRQSVLSAAAQAREKTRQSG